MIGDSRGRTVAVVVGCSAVLGAAANADPRPAVEERSRLEVQPSDASFRQVTLDNPLGDVRVEGYDGTAIVVETYKRAPDGGTIDRLRVSLIPSADGRLRIATGVVDGRDFRPVTRSQVRVDLVIRAPRNARIEASTAGGRLQVENMDAGGELDSSSGAIAITNVSGQLITHSVSGPTSLTQVFGSVDAATLWSDLVLDTIGGPKLVASATMGKIDGRRVRSQEIELTTTGGAIVVEAETSVRGHLVVSTLQGNIDVRVRRRGPVLVRARAAKVNLGPRVSEVQRQAGWSTAIVGSRSDPAAVVELQSRYGVVQFAIVE